jgi:hypothetical protein
MEPLAGGFKTQVIPRSRSTKGIPARYQTSVVILEG